MVAATDNTEWLKNKATGYVTSYYSHTSVTVCNTSADLDYATDCGSVSVDYYDPTPWEWTPPRPVLRIDPRHDRPNKPLVHNKSRHIAPMHFRHVRTQQRKV